jgi:hypothetical protein
MQKERKERTHHSVVVGLLLIRLRWCWVLRVDQEPLELLRVGRKEFLHEVALRATMRKFSPPLGEKTRELEHTYSERMLAFELASKDLSASMAYLPSR